MKRLFFILFFMIFFCAPSQSGCYAQDEPYVIIGDNIWLLNEQGERLFLLPPSYYALCIGIDENSYTVTFNGVVGKVPKSSVSVTGYGENATGTAQTLYVSDKYSAFTGLKVRSSPEDASEEVDLFIPVGEPFTYLGSYPIGDNVWYYVCYSDKYGYVLSDFCDKKVEIRPFVPVEKEEKIEPQEEPPEQEENDDGLLKILVVSGVAVTVVVLLLVLILPRKGRKTRYYYET